jgi:hypothetical protein
LQAARQQVGRQGMRRFGAGARSAPQLCGKLGIELKYQSSIRAQILRLGGLADPLDRLRTVVPAAQPAAKPHRDLLQYCVTHDSEPRGLVSIIIIIEHMF